ncbi:MAG: GHKL domain-containing protein [Oligoflexus sp.]|nr:GHKL domain-containing protein [Oligoflexus sp.]
MTLQAPSPSSSDYFINARERGEKLFLDREFFLHCRIDRVFAKLLIAEWLFAFICSIIISPRSWGGSRFSENNHTLVAFFLGGLIISLPCLLVWRYPGRTMTRHVVAIAQVSISAILIHLTGGRIETHFHIFGSLAFLMFYRDWRVLITATVVVTCDHAFRGIYFPLSLYGIQSANSWRWVEHASWVIFEDIFLIYSCLTGYKEMRDICMRQGELELTNEKVEFQVAVRSKELAETHAQLDLERLRSAESSRLAALGEMAGGIAHEINNPLAVISIRSKHIKRAILAKPAQYDQALEYAEIIEVTSNRIATIVSGLRSFSRSGSDDPFESCDLSAVVRDTLNLCSERLKTHGVQLKIGEISKSLRFEGRSVQISQVLINLLNNSYDAVSQLEERWIKLDTEVIGEWLQMTMTDSGPGIPDEILAKIMQPFFTTKPVGMGTGLGLSISKGIIEQHRGQFEILKVGDRNHFVIRLPREKPFIVNLSEAV